MKKITCFSVEDFRVGPNYSLQKEDGILSECYLQGDGDCEGGLEREHVIPRVLFTPDANGDPIILRACHRHNKEKAKIDESAARLMQLTSGNGEHRRYSRWLDYSRSNFQPHGNVKPGGRLLKEIMDSMAPRDITTPAGIVLHANQPSIRMKDNPVNELYITIAKGLTVRNTGKFFDWSKYEFHLDGAQTIEHKNRILDDAAHPIFMAYRHRTFTREWPGVFSFFGTSVEDGGNTGNYAAAWGLVGYSTHAAVVLMMPAGSRDANMTPRPE